MQTYADKILRLTVRLEQLSKGLISDTQLIIRNLQKEILSAILVDPINSKAVLNEVKKAVKDYSLARYAELDELLFEHESATAQVAHAAEIQSFASLGEAAISHVKSRDVKKLISDAFDVVMPGLGSGRQITVKEMLTRFKANGTQDLMNIAERAFVEGLPVRDITNLVRDVSGLQMRQSETIARTVIQAVANQARQDVADQLPVSREIWMATLDSKTCGYCQGLDGQCKGKGKFPRLAHPNCRCVRLYVVDDMTCEEAKKDLNRIERGLDGKSKKMGKYESYGEWIATQPVAFQEEALGIQRSKLLRDGEITFDKMYTATGKRLTIDEIKARYLRG